MFYEFYGTRVVERLCVLLGMFVVYFENVCFAHRALTRPLGTTTTTTTTTTNNNNHNNNNNTNTTTTTNVGL